MGTIPLDWLRRSGEVTTGAGGGLVIALWYRAKCSRNGKVRLTKHLRDRFGVDRTVAFRNLEKLQTAGLVSVERTKGRAPVVTLLPYSRDGGGRD